MPVKHMKEGNLLIHDFAGDHQSMGWQQGQQFSRLLGTMAEDLAEALNLPVAGDPFGAFFEYFRRNLIPPVTSMLGRLAPTLLHRPLQRALPRQLERMIGLRTGCSTSSSPLTHFAPLLELVWGSQFAAGCTTVVVSPENSATGEPLMAKNIDASPHRLTRSFVRRNRPQHRLADLDLADPSMVGCLDGVNEAGLALSCNHRLFSKAVFSLVPPSLLCKELLETCPDVEQALRQIRDWPPIRPSIIILLDRQGEIAIIDITDEINIQRPRGYVVVTNHGHSQVVLTPERSSLRRRSADFFALPSSRQRQERMAAMLEGRLLSHQDLKTALADHHPHAGELSICRHGQRLASRCSLIVHPQQAMLEIAMNAPCQGTFQQAQLVQ